MRDATAVRAVRPGGNKCLRMRGYPMGRHTYQLRIIRPANRARILRSFAYSPLNLHTRLRNKSNSSQNTPAAEPTVRIMQDVNALALATAFCSRAAGFLEGVRATSVAVHGDL